MAISVAGVGSGGDGGRNGSGEQAGDRVRDVLGTGEDGGNVGVRAEHPDLVGPGTESLAQRRPGVEVPEAVDGDR